MLIPGFSRFASSFWFFGSQGTLSFLWLPGVVLLRRIQDFGKAIQLKHKRSFNLFCAVFPDVLLSLADCADTTIQLHVIHVHVTQYVRRRS